MSRANPYRVLIAALGGDGGGVLAAWISQAAVAAGLPVQRTSIPGLAQRTGATSYYLELLNRPREADARAPVFSLYPTPGQVDLLVATEFVEAGRMMLAGYVTADRTHLLASTHRTWTISERIHLGDGRFSTDRLHAAAARLAHATTLLDAHSIARQVDCAPNAVLLGAIAAQQLLPLTEAHFRAAIRAEGKAADANLRGFAAGLAGAGAAAPPPAATRRIPLVERFDPAQASPYPASPVAAPGGADPAPGDLESVAAIGEARTSDYQDTAYAALYRARIARLTSVADTGHDDWLAEAARQLALLMTPEDAMRVAQLKTRPERLARLRADANAAPGDLVHITEYLKPGADEIGALLPAPIGDLVTALASRRQARGSGGIAMKIRTTTVSGYLLLRTLSAMRRLRRFTGARRVTDALIEAWLAALTECANRDTALALSVARCAGLVKGYGDTRARGEERFRLILAAVADPAWRGGNPTEQAAAVDRLHRAALADEDGRTLQAAWREVTM